MHWAMAAVARCTSYRALTIDCSSYKHKYCKGKYSNTWSSRNWLIKAEKYEQWITTFNIIPGQLKYDNCMTNICFANLNWREDSLCCEDLMRRINIPSASHLAFLIISPGTARNRRVVHDLTIDKNFSNIFPTGKCLLQKIKYSCEASFIFD